MSQSSTFPGAYGVIVPDLPGCTSGGPTIDEALRNAVEAVTLCGWKMPMPMAKRFRNLWPAEKLRRDPNVAAALAKGACLPMCRSCLTPPVP